MYLTNTDINEALKIYFEKLSCQESLIKKEKIDIRNALRRVTACPIFAKISAPNHNAAAMDGIMVIAEKTYSANEANPVILEMGDDFEYINTGHLILDPYDSVIMIEDVVKIDENHVKIIAAAAPWQHIRPIGEDIVYGEMILSENHQIMPVDIAACMNGGNFEIEVYEKIRVGIMPTGNEITDDYSNLEKGKSFDTNSWMFKAMIEEVGGVAIRVSPVSDDKELLKKNLLELLTNNHIVIINAGSSAGGKDYTVNVIEELGEVVLHGLAIKPGKPTILSIVNGKPVIGVPGYTGSAFVVFEEVVIPVIKCLQKISLNDVHIVEAIVSRRIVSSLKFKEYIRVKLGKVGEKLIATPLNRGAGVTMSLVKADGVLIVPQNSEGYESGAVVGVRLNEDISHVENTVVSIGSHDLIMDIIGNIMAKDEKFPAYLSSSHVGSMGGIMALKRGEAHIAPIHLLDPLSGEYNSSYLERFLIPCDVSLVKGVKRQQGFIVPKGNPKKVGKIADLCTNDMKFVNRQKGSGTRVLTDYLVKKSGILPEKINGFARELTTHMAVAAAVESGSADVGIGVFSAAKALDLDFVPIGFEEYDFVVPNKHINLLHIKKFIEVLESKEFEGILAELGGYER